MTAIILDTDIGYDPDDMFALLFLHKLAKIACIITANEVIGETPSSPGKRLRFVSNILANLADTTTPVYSGESLGMNTKFTVDEMLVDGDARESGDHVDALKDVIDMGEPVTYIGIGGFTNLAKFIEKYPLCASKMRVVIMGGALDYERHAGWIEYNIKIDQKSVETVLNAKGIDLTLVMAQTTHNPIYEVTSESRLYKRLKASHNPVHQMLAQHCDLWFQKRDYKHGTLMHDPLTVSAALGMEYVQLHEAKVVLKEGRFIRDEKDGVMIKYSDPASQAAEFMEFLEETLF